MTEHPALSFSIIIPAYNYGERIEAAIDSVFNQNPGDFTFEVVVIDDGSTDNTLAILETLSDTYTGKLKIISQNNAGPSVARNRGVEESSGDIILFLDADDELTSDALTRYTECFQSNSEIDVVFAAHISSTEGGSKKTYKVGALSGNREQDFIAYWNKQLSITTCTTALKRSAVDLPVFCNELRQGEDIPVFSRLLTKQHCAIIDAPTAIINRHSDSFRHDIDAAMKADIALIDLMFENNYLPVTLEKYKKFCLSQRYLSLFRTAYKAGKINQAKKFYRKAIGTRPANILRIAYLRKYVRCFFR